MTTGARMPHDIRQSLGQVLEHLTIHDYSAFTFAGERFETTAPPASAAPPNGAPPLLQSLQSVLYTFCYTREFAGAPLPPAAQAHAPDAQFIAELSRHSQSQDTWDSGWRIYRATPSGEVYAEKGERQHLARPGAFIAAAGAGLVPGATINCFCPRESAIAQYGFYFAYGETPNDVWDDFRLVRFYFNVPSAHAADLVRFLTVNLNKYLIPFQMKTLNAPAAYSRADAAVLYVARRYFTIVARLLTCRRSELAYLSDTTPLFTKPILPGVGAADEPGTGESFGMHRCRLVSEALLDAFAAGSHEPSARLAAVDRRFRHNGLELDRPYISPGLTEFPDCEPA
jgi:hypothetical protein